MCFCSRYAIIASASVVLSAAFDAQTTESADSRAAEIRLGDLRSAVSVGSGDPRLALVVNSNRPVTNQLVNLSDAASRIIRRTNEFRKNEGRHEVKTDDKLTATARYFADYMART